MRHPSKLRAFTLVELMVSIFLAAILMTILVRLFAVSARAGREEFSRSSAETAVLMVIRALENDLQRTTPAGISIAADETKLIVHPMDKATSDGKIEYEKRAIAWSLDTATQQLTRREFDNAFPDPTRPQRLTDPEISALVGGGGKTSRLLDKVTLFSVENPDSVALPSVGSPLTVSVHREVEGVSTRTEVTMRRMVVVRSGGN